MKAPSPGGRASILPGAALAVFALSVASGDVALCVLIVLGCVAAVVLARSGLRRAALRTAALATLTMPWDGVKVGGVRPGDALLFLALVLLLLACVSLPLPHMPSYFWLMILGVLVVGVAHEIVPTSPNYLTSRTVVNAIGLPTHTMGTNLGSMSRFLVSVVGVPLLFALCAVMFGQAAIRMLAITFAAGAAASGFAAFTDRLHLTAFEVLAQQQVGSPLRTSGLSQFANGLAAICVIAVAVPVWLLLTTRGSSRLWGAVLLLGILAGVYSSGSRGGAICLLVTFVAMFVVLPDYGRRPAVLVTLGVLLSAGALLLASSAGTALLHSLRLVGSTNAADSDVVRSTVAQQGYRDFAHSPIDGVGLQVVFEAHNVYLQALASGGVLLLGSVLAMMLGATWNMWRLRRASPLAAALCAGLAGQLAVNFFENMLTNRYMYVGIGLALGLGIATRQVDGVTEPTTDQAAVPTRDALWQLQ